MEEKDTKTNEASHNKKKTLLFEFIRYAFVGGVSAVFDLLTLWIFTEYVFNGVNTGFPLACSITAGFIVGLVTNYLLSSLWVFTSKEQKIKSKSVKAFLIYAIVGIIGYVMTQLLMHLGMLFVPTEGIWYLILNVFVKGVVLIWNYIGRKIFVYKGN